MEYDRRGCEERNIFLFYIFERLKVCMIDDIKYGVRVFFVIVCIGRYGIKGLFFLSFNCMLFVFNLF